MFNLCNRMSSLSARPSKIGAVPGPAPPDKLGRATTQARPPAITTPNGRGRRPRPALVAGAGPGPPRRGNLTVPGGTVGSAVAAALLVGAVHPHPQLGAGTDRFRSPTSPATGRFIAVAQTPRSTDSATRTGVDSRALAGHRPSDPASSGREGPFQMLPSRRRRRMVGGAWRERSDRCSRQSAFRPVDNVPIPAGGCNAV